MQSIDSDLLVQLTFFVHLLFCLACLKLSNEKGLLTNRFLLAIAVFPYLALLFLLLSKQAKEDNKMPVFGTVVFIVILIGIGTMVRYNPSAFVVTF
jgi:hypothetical protein